MLSSLALTPLGRKTADDAMTVLAHAFEPYLDRLSAAQQHGLKTLLSRML
jgi:hypothetical protein